MAVSIPQIKSAAALIKDHYNISESDSLRVIASYKADSAKIRAILAGDLSSVPGAAASVGVVLGDSLQDISPAASPEMIAGGSADGVHTKRSYKKRSRAAASDRVTTSKNNTDINGYNNMIGGSVGLPDGVKNNVAINDGVINNNAVVGLSDDINGDIINADGLPLGFSDTVAGWLQDYALQNNIDLEKCAAIQWRSLCLSIGEKIQASGVLRDHAREKSHGGKIYNPSAVAALVPIWEKLTGYYKHIPLAVDFVAFSGVSRQWFNDYQGRGLTSSSVQIAQKVHDIESAALSVALCDSRENPTGRIYYTKARLGWRESTEIIHTSAKETHAGGALPVFDGSAGFLTDNAV